MHNLKVTSKKGQLKISFGMIFSIVLIIIFLALAFYVIPKFLDFQRKAQVGLFITDLQDEVDKMWQGSHGSVEQTYSLPTKIEFVCFEEDARVFFKPIGSGYGMDDEKIEHLEIIDNDFCIEVIDGKIDLIIKKDYGESLVMIEDAS